MLRHTIWSMTAATVHRIDLLAAAPHRASWRRWLLSAFIMFIALYAPYAWLLVIDYPWSDYRWQWIQSWLALPLLLPATLASRVVEFEVLGTVSIIVMSALSLSLLWLLTSLAARSRWTLLILAIVVLTLSVFNALGAYNAFRA